jgi:hypothetical protein
LPLFTELPRRPILGNQASGIADSRKLSFRCYSFWETQRMTLSKGLGINPTLFLHFTFPLQIAGFPWRARQDSNLRPSDS